MNCILKIVAVCKDEEPTCDLHEGYEVMEN